MPSRTYRGSRIEPALPLLISLLLVFYFAQHIRAESIDFNRDVRPILSDKCYFCHGPDSESRSADLRLDEEASAKAVAIRVGKPDESELIKRIYHDDPDVIMPPPNSNLSLTAKEKEIIRHWIEQGAKYDRHWALVPPNVSIVPPKSDEDSWAKNPIDKFVWEKLQRESLVPSAQADRETLIRRVTFDLTGLPPTIEEINTFKLDIRENALELLVDRLLATDSYGEHMAVDWLDAARYADTYGYQADRYRAMWPWRDWVISAFNRNMHYDDFLKWQIAGDLIPNATSEQVLATAFNRNHRQTNEGGSVEEEFRAEYVADRINTFGAAVLGMTLECCRCHDHKYDPLTQKNYYELAAFFNSIDESGLYSHFTDSVPTPTLALSEEGQRTRLEELDTLIATQEQRMQTFVRDSSSLVEKWIAAERFGKIKANISAVESSQIDEVEPTQKKEYGRLSDAVDSALTQALLGDFPLESITEAKVENRNVAALVGRLSEGPQITAGKVGNGLRLSGENSLSTDVGGKFTRNDPFSISLWMNTPSRFSRAVIFHRSKAWTDSGSRGYELILEDGRLSAAIIHFWPGNAIRVKAIDELPIDQWSHVTMAYDGSSRAAGLKLYLNGLPIATETVRDSLTKTANDEVTELTFGQRFRDVGFKDGKIDEIKVFSRCLSDLEAIETFSCGAGYNSYTDDAEFQQIGEFFFATQCSLYADMQRELRSLRNQRSALFDAIPEIMVMHELEKPRPTHLLLRGAYDSPGDMVDRNTPESILPMRPEWPRNRLGLAEWLVCEENPLTSRVAVNRFWQSFFGVGLVSTTEDFGLQGALPTHPELLDWLAVDFVRSGWDVKRFVKQIVMSATYQQSSDPTPSGLANDPSNTLLSRGPSHRLGAEMIRDNALKASGLLIEQIGGPPVKPYEPPGLWEEKSGEKYVRDENAGSHRRSIYTFWKRTSPPPSMMTFDASNREVCVVRRQSTLTPLQVLVLLNDPQYVEASRALAASALTGSSNSREILKSVFLRLTSRVPCDDELFILSRMLDEQTIEFESNPERAQQLLTIGDYRSDPSLNQSQLAALTVVVQGLMSYDETIMKR